jgi:hypothetical protein
MQQAQVLMQQDLPSLAEKLVQQVQQAGSLAACDPGLSLSQQLQQGLVALEQLEQCCTAAAKCSSSSSRGALLRVRHHGCDISVLMF